MRDAIAMAAAIALVAIAHLFRLDESTDDQE